MESADELLARIEANEQKLRRSQSRELRLLQAENLHSLLTELLEGLRESFRLPYVGVVLCDPDHDIRHLLLATGHPAESYPRLSMVESLTEIAPQYSALRSPWLGPWLRRDHQAIYPGVRHLGSIAIIPLMHRGRLIGSINLGSDDPARFTRDLATDFLAHLGVIAAFCIENTINRARLLRSGFTDVLTGWHNRRYLEVRLLEELARAKREASHLVCLLIDADHFKQVNDTWGHAGGDAVLRELASRIALQVRASDVAARFGGEEFIVLLPDTHEASGEQLGERIRQAIAASEFTLPCGGRTHMTVSIGIAGAQPAAEEADERTIADSLVRRADVALYRAKALGRNRVEVDWAA